jgi:hypothetical protein
MGAKGRCLCLYAINDIIELNNDSKAMSFKISVSYQIKSLLDPSPKFLSLLITFPQWFRISFLLQILFLNDLDAQFPGPAGTPGSTAIYKDSSIFKGWAIGCTLVRGYQNIADTSLGFTSFGDSSSAIGKAGENGVVSLGDAGYAILTFDLPITNGPGFDFAVFENAFNDNFLELAFVEVSSDGVNYFRFPAVSNTPADQQIGPFDNRGDATKIHNLAGKYRAHFGTPFDLEELKNEPGLNVQSVTHVKIIDVVGSIDPTYARYDKNNHPINDPFPTSFPSGGFDLDAVGVIHQLLPNEVEHYSNPLPAVYPNPIRKEQRLQISEDEHVASVVIYQADGRGYFHGCKQELQYLSFLPGLYFIAIETPHGKYVQKLMVQ